MIPVSEDSIINAVEKVSKSVVNIASVRLMQDQLLEYFRYKVLDQASYLTIKDIY